MRRPFLAAIGATSLTLVLVGCGSSGIYAAPLQASLTRAFGHLYVLQQSELGFPVPSLPALEVATSCIKGTPGSAQSGAGGNWTCHITYLDDINGQPTAVSALYDVNVQSDGCYAADSDGPASASTPSGQVEVADETQTITGPGKKQIPNPLWLIDGCFDIS